MRNVMSFKSLLLLLLATIVLYSCQKEENVAPQASSTSELIKQLEKTFDNPEVTFDGLVENRTHSTVLEFLQADPQYSILIQAASRVPSLVELLSNPRLSVTLFAPTNAAFVQFLADNGFASLDQVPVHTLEVILGNHLLFFPKTASQLNAYEHTLTFVSFNGGASFSQLSLYVNATHSGVILNGNVNVVGANNLAGRSVVHKVDRVIALPNIVTFATSNPNFSSLVAALTRPDLSIDFVSVLNGKGPFTVLAPTNQAFDNLLVALRLNSLNDIPTATLEKVLLYHVASGNVRSKTLAQGRTINTLATPNTYRTGLENHQLFVFANQNKAKVIVKDVQSINGVIHAIDTVILP